MILALVLKILLFTVRGKGLSILLSIWNVLIALKTLNQSMKFESCFLSFDLELTKD